MATAAVRQTGGSVRVTLWILLVVYIFNFIDRQIVNILAEPIARDLSLSDTQIGLMTGLAFALFYTVLGLPIARYADRPSTSRPRLIALALAVWSAMTALCGLAQNFIQLLLARIGVGVGEAGCTPAAHSLISDMVPKERRASALGFYALGIPTGTVLGMIIGGQLVDVLGWRHAFMIVGLPGIAMAVVVWFVLKDPRYGANIAGTGTPQPLPTGDALRSILSSRALVLLLIAASSAAFLSYGKVTWATIFFQRTHGLTPGQVGLWFGIVNGAGGILGTWLSGRLADRFGAEKRQHVLTAAAVGMLLVAPLSIWGYSAEDWRVALAILFFPVFFGALYYGPTYSSVQGLVTPQSRALASAVLLFFQNLIGLGLGPLLFGMLSDGLKPIYGEDSVRWVLYCASVMSLIPAFFFWRCSLRLDEELDRKG
ncbi:MFS transporter [Qipengyuania sp. YG27]|uniref:MFS transporter n=1 Tax=Qipengyuania mesophila TaxID=2867246 RepID=A0ABS7JYU8_9SPHN|nr:MFS transporter [Qipengyuania mesophila]MBX7502698.1 MFS transporter [Qipengyuania mesophila]